MRACVRVAFAVPWPVRVLFVENHDSFSLNVVESRFDPVPGFRLSASSSMMESCLP